MNFQQLEYVIAVHKAQQFFQAAEDCNITQATLSAMIRKLEAELDITLFDRSRKPVKTTQEGLAFIEIAKSILSQRDTLFTLSTKEQKLKGSLSIGIIPTIATSLLPIILPTILEENPDLNLKVIELTTDEIKKQLLTDKLDLGIFATPGGEDDLEEQIMYYEPMMVYGILDSAKEFVSSEDVKEGQVWLLEEGHCFRNQVMTICEIREKKLAHQNLEFRGSAFETLLNLTDRFGGYTLLPELYYQSLREDRKIKTKHFQKPLPVREISLVSYRSSGQKYAIDYLSSLISRLVKDKLSSSSLSNQDMDVIGI